MAHSQGGPDRWKEGKQGGWKGLDKGPEGGVVATEGGVVASYLTVWREGKEAASVIC